MTRTARTLLALATVLVALMVAAPANAAPDYSPTVQTTHRTGPTPAGPLHIVAMHRLPGGRLAVALEDGRSYDVRPCRFEDGHRCWWDADARGNRRGDTVLSLLGWTWTP